LVSPVSENKKENDMEGLICARGALSKIDKEIDELVEKVYANREKETDRKVDI